MEVPERYSDAGKLGATVLPWQYRKTLPVCHHHQNSPLFGTCGAAEEVLYGREMYRDKQSLTWVVALGGDGPEWVQF